MKISKAVITAAGRRQRTLPLQTLYKPSLIGMALKNRY